MPTGRKQTKEPAVLRGKRQKRNKYMCGMPVVLSAMEKAGRGSELLRGRAEISNLNRIVRASLHERGSQRQEEGEAAG